MRNSLFVAIVCLALAGCCTSSKKMKGAPEKAQVFPALYGALGTYNNAPRLQNGRVDHQKLLAELAELRANTYNWLIWHRDTDWEDLQVFLPLAAEKRINVWVTLVPPSESPPKTKLYSEPFKLDYVRWAEELGRLSAKHPNLVAWSIDDFVHNVKFFTPELLQTMRARTRQFNERFAFVPCCYYIQTTPAFAAKYSNLVDGILFPYNAGSAGERNLKDPNRVEDEVAKLREIMGRKDLPIIVDVYATAHARLGATTPDYIKQVMIRSRRVADGIMIYCHQDKQKSADKFNVIKSLFNEWAQPKNPDVRLDKAALARREVVRGTYGTYGLPPRLPEGRVNSVKLLTELKDIHANTYHWLIGATNDWDDLKMFLPQARQANIRVWVTVLPPSESPPKGRRFSEPYRLDYIRWAEEFARLSLKEPSLVAWSVDDFTHNLRDPFTPAFVAKMQAAAHAINPRLAFVPCCYYEHLTPDIAGRYKDVFDGVLFPYRSGSSAPNLQDTTRVGVETERLRKFFGPNMPIVLDVYTTGHSRLGKTTPAYTDEVMQLGGIYCDGVLIFCHQDPTQFPDKYKVLKERFGDITRQRRK